MDDYRGISVSSLISNYGTMTGVKTTALIFYKFNRFSEFCEWYSSNDPDTRIHVYSDLDVFDGEIIGVDKSSDLIYLYKHISEELNNWEMSKLKCSDDTFLQGLTFRVTPYRRCQTSDTELRKFSLYSGFDYDLYMKYKLEEKSAEETKTDS